MDMSIKLNGKYFSDKEFKSMSSAGIRDFVLNNPQTERLAWEKAQKLKGVSEEEVDFFNMSDADLVSCMRKMKYINNLPLRDELISRGDTIVDLILEKFVRSFNDAVLDHTFVVITSLKYDCEAYLLEQMKDIKSAYTQSMACQILGFIGSERSIEVLDYMYKKLTNDYPLENYGQGPLYGMWTLGYRLGQHHIEYDVLEY